MKTTEDHVKITLYLVAALKYWRTLVHHLAEKPTKAQILVSEYTYYLQYTDACLVGAWGGYYARTLEHTTLGMEICVVTGYSKLNIVSYKSKS